MNHILRLRLVKTIHKCYFLHFLPVGFGGRHQKIHVTSQAQMNAIAVQYMYIAPKYAEYISLFDTKISVPPAVHKTSVEAPPFMTASDEDCLFLASLRLTNMTKMSGWWPNGNMHDSGWRPIGTMSLGWRLHIHTGPRLRMTIKYSDGTKARMRRIFRICSIWPRSWASFLLSLHHLSSGVGVGGGGWGGCIPESLYGVTLCGKPICSQGRLRPEFSAI